MSRANQALEVAFAAAEQLPANLRLELAERVIESVRDDEETMLISFKWFSAKKQARLHELMDKNNEVILTSSEKSELKRLVEEHGKIVLHNSEALARISRPDLFDKNGRPIKSRMRAALKAKPEEGDGNKRRTVKK